MPKYVITLLTTQPDLLGTIGTHEKLEKYAKAINEESVRVNYISYLHIFRPHAKSVRAWLKSFEENDFAVLVESDTFDRQQEVTPKGVLNLIKSSTAAQRLFYISRLDDFLKDHIVVALEELCFPDDDPKQGFLRGLDDLEAVQLRERQDRHAFLVGHAILLYLGLDY